MTCKIAHSMQLLLSYSGVLFAVEAIYIIYTTHCPSQPEKPYQDFAASENLINFQFYNLFRDDREQTVHFMLRKDRRQLEYSVVALYYNRSSEEAPISETKQTFLSQTSVYGYICFQTFYTCTMLVRRFHCSANFLHKLN